MISYNIILPFIIPLLTATVGLIVKTPSLGRRLFFALSASIHFILSGLLLIGTLSHDVMVLPMGGWEAPFGIAITIDTLSGLMITLCSLISGFALLYSFAETPVKDEPWLRLPLMQFLTGGITLSFITGDFFNLFVSFEIMLIASYALMSLESSNKNIKHILPYLMINLIGSTLFLIVGGLFYGLFGSLSFAAISQVTPLMIYDPRLVVIGVLLVVIFGIKAGFFPLYYWLPNSYPILPASVGALYSALLTKVGIYTLLRVFGTLLPHNLTNPHDLVLLLAAPTMIFGILAAWSSDSIKKILCYNLISHIGFMMLAIGLFTSNSLKAALFYMTHHVIVMGSLFFLSGIIIKLYKSDSLKKIGNIWNSHPIIGILFLMQAFSLAGLPPFSGFWGKYMILKEGLLANQSFIVTCLIIASILTLASMLKIVFQGLWTETQNTPSMDTIQPMVGVASVLVGISLIIGLLPQPFLSVTNKAADTLLNKENYARIVYSFHTIKSAEKSHEKASGGH